MKLKLILTMAIVGAALALPSGARGAPPAQDSVSLTEAPAVFDNGFVTVEDLSATSGPNGENPTGEIRFNELQQIFDVGGITCLAVTGNSATFNYVSEFLGGAIATIHLVDDSPDTLSVIAVGRAPSDCSPGPDAQVLHLTSGDITVVDAQPMPTSKEQCKNGGWRNFPQFKNQGQCIAFVNHNS
jgi:hypothetical protein